MQLPVVEALAAVQLLAVVPARPLLVEALVALPVVVLLAVVRPLVELLNLLVEARPGLVAVTARQPGEPLRVSVATMGNPLVDRWRVALTIATVTVQPSSRYRLMTAALAVVRGPSPGAALRRLKPIPLPATVPVVVLLAAVRPLVEPVAQAMRPAASPQQAEPLREAHRKPATNLTAAKGLAGPAVARR